MNELARLGQELEACVYCPELTNEHDNDGVPIHEVCQQEREAERIDRAYEATRDADADA